MTKHKPQGDKEIISLLNDILTHELTSINQYFLHSEMCSHWGYKRMHGINRKHSIEEMKHAEHFISDYGLFPYCRALLNAIEFVYLM